MTIDDIARIIARLEKTDVTECVVEHGTETLCIKFDRTTKFVSDAGPRSSTSASAAAVGPETLSLKTPGTGFFRHEHPLAVGGLPAGTFARSGQHVGYVEVDSVFCAVVTPVDGIPQRSLVAEGELVGFGQTVCELSINHLEPLRDGDA